MRYLVIIAIIIAIAYTYDPQALKPWGHALGEAGKATAKVVRTAGEGADEALHDTARSNNTIVDRTRNSIEDQVDYTIYNVRRDVNNQLDNVVRR